MAFGLTPGKLGFKLGDVLMGLQDGTEDTPEAIKTTGGRAHFVQYLWNPSTLAYEVATVSAGSSGGGLTNAELRASEVPIADGESRNFLWRILQMLLAPLGYDKSLARYRGTTLIESGTVTTVTTVTTCTTVTGLTNINGRNGDMLINSSGNTAWALNVRARIT